MTSWTEWEFKGEFLTVSKVSELGPADAPADEVALPRGVAVAVNAKALPCASRCARGAC